MEELALKINEEIKNSLLYKDYINLKNVIDNNEELLSIKEEMELLKKDICKSKDEDKLDKYYDLEKKYKSNSFVKEYLIVKEELKELLKNIADILSLN